MARNNISQRATVLLEVNGKQAEQNLKQMQAEAVRLKAALDKANDPKTAKRLRNEYERLTRQIERNSTALYGVKSALKNIDSATPKELSKAIRSLRRELDNIPPGTKVWKEHVRNLQVLQERLDAVRGQLRVQESLWTRFNSWLNNCQTAIVGATAALTGLVMAGKAAVDKFASMDQEMANVRKFTGMTADEVEALNEKFKKIDTRTSREDLNKLAQEAGRLGKTSQEDVLGFVRAADKINVALDDLGDGATLTLSKLTGIFGDEKRLGTEKALLSVGSVINELSQNCSASAPYLAEFASRMGGVGAQAKMTVQQIMGFAAVLDSNEQQVEASSTALAQVITRIYTDPAKYAKAAGMDVEKFARLVKTDMNSALIELLSTLNRAGGMDVLSPMFKDMGETGSRAISALSTLATHIDEVRSQQEVANIAFKEATSIDKEFEVQNTTVQASLDKAKKRVGELAVELGRKLQPVMRLCLSSTTIAIKVLSEIIDFLDKHIVALISLSATILAYRVAVNAATIAVKAHAVASAISQGATVAWTVAVNAAHVATALFSGNMRKLRSEFAMLSVALKSNPIGLAASIIVAAIGAITAVISHYVRKINDKIRADREAAEYQKKLIDVSGRANELMSDEATKLKILYETATSEAYAKEQRINAAKKLISMYPGQFKNMTAEEMMLGKAKAAYDNLTDSIIKNARARAAAELVYENEKELIKKKAERADVVQKRRDASNERDRIRAMNRATASRMGNTAESMTGALAMNAGGMQQSHVQISTGYYDDIVIETTKNANALTKEINALQKAKNTLIKEYRDDLAFQNARAAQTDSGTQLPSSSGPMPEGGSPSGSPSNSDRFEAEKAWREKEEALARIAYATGETDYLAHTRRMDEIAVQFFTKQLDHTDLDANERLKITAELREAERKLREDDFAKSESEENARHNEEMAGLKQDYIDGRISRKTYDMRLEEMEIEHQRRLVAIFEEGTDKKLAAEKRLQDLLAQQMEKRKTDTERLEKEIADARMKYFGLSQSEKDAKFAEEMDMLNLLYDQMKLAAGDNAAEMERIDKAYLDGKRQLEETYNQQSVESTGLSYKEAIAKSAEWLQGEGGQALSGALNVAVSGMSSIFSQLSSLVQAETEIQTAAIEKRYEAEVNAAQGNSYRVAKAEKKKEAEIAKVKNEANRKLFAMQVIQAVAQTAQNALAAFGSAAAVPVIGYILAPIAAAMAVAAGAIQIASIKKQQAAASAQGYAEGGFTRPGGKYEPAGVVHAGEWVASQKLVNSPVARPIIEALEYAQRHNVVGSLRSSDVSRSITAPAALTRIADNDGASLAMVESALRTAEVLSRLNDRLDRPFVTVNTVTGDAGTKQAQDEYLELMKNVTPKSKQK